MLGVVLLAQIIQYEAQEGSIGISFPALAGVEVLIHVAD
jgi:hypothetical protein